MARFRLQHGTTEIELPQGEFVIGRGAPSNLTLDDALVSRRHARIVTEGDYVFIEDLESRNGFLHNGRDTRTRVTLRHLDRLRIGSHDLVLIDTAAQSAVKTASAGFCRMCGTSLVVGVAACSICGTAVGTNPIDKATVELLLPRGLDASGGAAAPSPAFALVGTIAKKALALGRIEEAERMLAPMLATVEKRLLAGESVDSATFLESISFASKLAEGPTSSSWIAYILNLHGYAKRVPDVALVDQLHEVARRHRYSDTKSVARLISILSASPALTPADRFVVKRLESLHRRISA